LVDRHHDSGSVRELWVWHIHIHFVACTGKF
jgi:hypothetical protein